MAPRQPLATPVGRPLLLPRQLIASAGVTRRPGRAGIQRALAIAVALEAAELTVDEWEKRSSPPPDPGPGSFPSKRGTECGHGGASACMRRRTGACGAERKSSSAQKTFHGNQRAGRDQGAKGMYSRRPPRVSADSGPHDCSNRVNKCEVQHQRGVEDCPKQSRGCYPQQPGRHGSHGHRRSRDGGIGGFVRGSLPFSHFGRSPQ